MEQRRKIIVPTGAEADEELSTPHFDAEATLLARPVVPLTEPVEPPLDVYMASNAAAAYAPRAATASLWKRSTLILIILAAVSVGVLSGLAIGLYQSRRKAPAAPVVARPTTNEPEQATAQPQTEPVQAVRVNQPEEQEPETTEEAQIPAATADKEKPNKETKNDSADESRRDDKQVARENRKRDEERVPPPAPVVPDNSPADYSVMDERDVRIERRERRREERKEARRAERRRQREEDDGPSNIPRNVERARQEINRIRDIFEGSQP